MNIFILSLICLLVEVAAVAKDVEIVKVGTQIDVGSGTTGGEGTDISETPVANPIVIKRKTSVVERELRRTGKNIKRELARVAKRLERRARRLERRAGRMNDAEAKANIQERKQEASDASQKLRELSTQLFTFFNTENGLEQLLNKVRPIPALPSQLPVEATKRNLKINHDPLTKLINELKLFT